MTHEGYPKLESRVGHHKPTLFLTIYLQTADVFENIATETASPTPNDGGISVIIMQNRHKKPKIKN